MPSFRQRSWASYDLLEVDFLLDPLQVSGSPDSTPKLMT